MRKTVFFALAFSISSACFGGPPSGSKPKTEAELRAEKAAAYKQKKESEKDARLKKLQNEAAFKQQLMLQQRHFMFQQQLVQQSLMQQQMMRDQERFQKDLDRDLRELSRDSWRSMEMREAIRGGIGDALMDYDLRNPR